MSKLKSNLNLKETNLFSTQEEAAQYILLEYLLKSQEPVGSWVLKVMLELRGIDVSIATVGRYLKSLDSKNFTELIGSQGRVITTKGASFVKQLAIDLEMEDLQRKLIDAVHPKNFEELVDVLLARKALESESARLAALRATDKDIEEIKKTLERHRICVENKSDPTSPSHDFHKTVTSASKNRFLIAALDILIYEELKVHLHINDLVTRERGAEYGIQHIAIAKAIEERDEYEAERRMANFMDTIINDIKEQSERNRELDNSES